MSNNKNTSSYLYWKKREEKQREINKKKENGYKKEIQEIYKYMLDNIQKEIDAFYTKYAGDKGITMQEAKKAVSQADIKELERKAKKYVKEKNFTNLANDEMKLYNLAMKINRLELLKANIGLELIVGHDELEKFFEEILNNRTLEELKRQADILGKSIKNDAKSIVDASFKNATFSQRIWMYQDLLKNDLYNLLSIGLIQGRNPRVLAREIKKRFNVRTSQAERLMQTEMARVQTDAQLKSYVENGFNEYEYIACGGADVCPICKALDGKIFKVSKMTVAENAPPMHPYCHCSTAPHYSQKDFNILLNRLEK